MSEQNSSSSTPLFTVSELRLSQDFASAIGVEKVLIAVPVRKPNRQEFVRVHPSPDYCIETAVLELKEERETYLVAPSLWSGLSGELIPKRLYLTVNRQNVITLWPIRMHGEDGRLDSWNRSGVEAAEQAKSSWVRVVANMSLGAYDVFQASGVFPDPVWPELKFEQILQIAFRHHYISDPDHVVLQRLRGEL